MKTYKIYFTLGVLFMLLVITIRYIENDWYNNMDGQCLVNDNCNGWQFYVITGSLIFTFIFLILGFLELYYINNDKMKLPQLKKDKFEVPNTICLEATKQFRGSKQTGYKSEIVDNQVGEEIN